MLKNISRQQSYIKRYRQIAVVLLSNGFGFLVERLNLSKYLPRNKKIRSEQGEKDKKSIAERMRTVLEELGPTFIKFGQLISTRPDILSPDYIKEFRKLQDEVPPVSFSEIEDVLISELGDNYRNNFLNIEEESYGAASIAQTHRAILKSGQEVILKLQRPHIEEKIKVDLDILKNLAKLAAERDIFSDFINPAEIVQEFSESLLKELDFKQEISNINIFQENFKDNSQIIIPRVYKKLSTKRVIVMEKIKGKSLKHLSVIEDEIDRSYLAKLGTEVFLKQILIDGFFHADPHPGNIYIVDKDKLAFIDFGIVGRLAPELRNSFTIILVSFLKKKIDIMLEEIIDVGVISQDINKKRMRADLQELVDRYYGLELAEIDFKIFFEDFQKLIYKYHIHMPREFFLLARALVVSEGVGLLIDPSLDIVKVSNNYLNKLIFEKLKPGNIVDKMVFGFWKFHKASKDIPYIIPELINKLYQDEFTIKFKHTNLKNLINQLDIISNRLSFSLIVSALIIGSSMILQTDIKPEVMDIPLLGLIGYMIAGVFGIILLIDIFRSGRY